jgi:hypothetical protein
MGQSKLITNFIDIIFFQYHKFYLCEKNYFE